MSLQALILMHSCCLDKKRLIRSKHVLNFAYILYLKLKDRKIDANIIENAVRRWIVLSILTSRYSSSPETWFDYDIKRFNEAEDVLMYIENIEKGELSDAFWETSLVDKLNTSVTSSLYFNVFIMSQIKNSDRGFLSKVITVKS